MKVAMVKLASTKRKRAAQHGGTAGQMVPANHGHLDAETGGERILKKEKKKENSCEGSDLSSMNPPLKKQKIIAMVTDNMLRDHLQRTPKVIIGDKTISLRQRAFASTHNKRLTAREPNQARN